MCKYRCLTFLSLLMLAVLLLPGELHAQTGNLAADTLEAFHNSVNGWGTTMLNAARKLFKITLGIELALLGIRMVLQRQQLNEIIAQFVMVLIFAGFVISVINHYAEWSKAMVEGLKSLAGSLGYSQVDAGDPFKTGAELVDQIMERTAKIKWGFQGVSEALFLFFSAVVISMSFMLVSAVVIIIKSEFIIVANIGLLLVGLGGSKIFKEYAINVMRYVFAVAVKLFAMQIVVGVGMDVFKTIDLGGDQGTAAATLVVASSASVLLLALSWVLPNTIAGIMNGSHIGGGNPLANAGLSIIKSGANTAGRAVREGGGSAVTKLQNLNLAHKIAKQENIKGFGNTCRHMRQTMQGANMAANPTSVKNQLMSQLNAGKALSQVESPPASATSPSAAAAPSASAIAPAGKPGGPVDMTRPPKFD